MNSAIKLLVLFSLFYQGNAFGQNSELQEIKTEIVSLASSYAGQGDSDFSKQKSLDILVQKLFLIAPQPPIKERLKFLYGAWKQVWGPYDYRNDDRGVDPEIGTNEIYQVISPDGYYYNVSPLYKNGDQSNEQIGLLRGEYKQDPENPDLLRVRFTNYPGVKPRPINFNIWDLPALAENNTLENRVTIVHTIIVRLFFAGGALREVYTDDDLRILYGSNGKNFSKEAIYVMTKMK